MVLMMIIFLLQDSKNKIFAMGNNNYGQLEIGTRGHDIGSSFKELHKKIFKQYGDMC